MTASATKATAENDAGARESAGESGHSNESSGERRMRQLFSLSGVLPLGVFLVAHTIVFAQALRSDAAFAGAASATRAMPGLAVIEAFFVFAPLALHASYGAWLTFKRRAFRKSIYPSGVRRLMHVTGIIALLFVALHVFELRFAARGVRATELYTVMASQLSSTSLGAPLRAMAYLVGAGAISFHFAAGMWGFSVARGWTPDKRARLAAAIGFSAIGAIGFVVSADVVTLFSTGARLIGRDVVTPLPIDPSATPCVPPAPPSTSAQ